MSQQVDQTFGYSRVNNSGGGIPKLHLDEDCYMLGQANDYRRVRLADYPERDLCKNCDDTVEVDRSAADFSYQRLLREAADE